MVSKNMINGIKIAVAVVFISIGIMFIMKSNELKIKNDVEWWKNQKNANTRNRLAPDYIEGDAGINRKIKENKSTINTFKGLFGLFLILALVASGWGIYGFFKKDE
jgi:hypothetical protein